MRIPFLLYGLRSMRYHGEEQQVLGGTGLNRTVNGTRVANRAEQGRSPDIFRRFTQRTGTERH